MWSCNFIDSLSLHWVHFIWKVIMWKWFEVLPNFLLLLLKMVSNNFEMKLQWFGGGNGSRFSILMVLIGSKMNFSLLNIRYLVILLFKLLRFLYNIIFINVGELKWVLSIQTYDLMAFDRRFYNRMYMHIVDSQIT